MFCRQCGRAYVTSEVSDRAHPLPETSVADLRARVSGRQKVYIIDD